MTRGRPPRGDPSRACPEHVAALVAEKRAAHQHSTTNRLQHAAPHSRDFLMRAADRGQNLGSITYQLSRLLAKYGAAELDAALADANTRGLVHPPSVRQLLDLGYLPYTNRYADLLFEVVTQRYMKAPIVITTNRPFSEWAAVFQSATCVGTLLDRLCHRVEIVQITGESWRLKEANERSSRRRARPPRNPG